MPNKPKLEEDYEEYNANIEAKAQEEIKKIRDKIKAVKAEAEKTGETLEANINQINSTKDQEKS